MAAAALPPLEVCDRQRQEAAQAALGRACATGNEYEAREALDAGANAQAAIYLANGTVGGTCAAVYLAASVGHEKLLAGVLLPAPVSADPDKVRTDTGATPCHVACANNHPDALTTLLAFGANPNRADQRGVTPCMTAASMCHTACLRALAAGAARQGRALDVNAMCTGGRAKGMTALDLAFGQRAAAAYLRDELGALRAEDVPKMAPRRRPKSAMKGKVPKQPSQRRQLSDQARKLLREALDAGGGGDGES